MRFFRFSHIPFYTILPIVVKSNGPRKIVEDGEKAFRECREVEDLMRRDKESLEYEKDRSIGTHGVNRKLTQILNNRKIDNKSNRNWNIAILCVAVATFVVAVASLAISHWPEKNDDQQTSNSQPDE